MQINIDNTKYDPSMQRSFFYLSVRYLSLAGALTLHNPNNQWPIAVRQALAPLDAKEYPLHIDKSIMYEYYRGLIEETYPAELVSDRYDVVFMNALEDVRWSLVSTKGGNQT